MWIKGVCVLLLVNLSFFMKWRWRLILGVLIFCSIFFWLYMKLLLFCPLCGVKHLVFILCQLGEKNFFLGSKEVESSRCFTYNISKIVRLGLHIYLLVYYWIGFITLKVILSSLFLYLWEKLEISGWNWSLDIWYPSLGS